MDDVNGVFQYADKLRDPFVWIALIAIGGVKQWWVFGHQYLEMKADRDQWRELATHGARVAKQAVNLASSTVSQQP